MLLQQKMAIAIAAALVLLSATAGFSQQAVQPVASRSSARTEVPVAAQTGSVRIVGDSSAKLVCLHKIQVAAQSDGLIQDLLAEEGQFVALGESLLTIDSRVAAAELQVAEKELEAAAKQAAQTAEVQYAEKAAAVSVEEYKVEKELYEGNASTFSQLQRKKLEMDRSKLGIDVARVKHETEVLARDVAEAKLDAAKVKLGLYNVVAPYDGIIVERLRDRGEWIRAGEPVLKLMHMNEMKVEAVVELKDLSFSDLQNAPMKVKVQLNAAQVLEIPTKVEFVSPEVIGNRVRLIAKIQNQKIGDTWLLGDGMIAQVEVEVTAR